jgi:maltodextrin utilization protein YvdJ
MKKIITCLLTLIFLTGCGYTPIYSSKNFDFNLEKIILSKNNQINSKVEKRLQGFSDKKSQKKIYLKVDVQKEINVIAKDSKGNPSRYEMAVSITIETTYDKKQGVVKLFQEKFNYNTNVNKFDLSQYEKVIEDLLISKNIDRIIFYLSKV